LVWAGMSFGIKRDDLNIANDASSLLISRSMIYSNFRGSTAQGPTNDNDGGFISKDPSTVKDDTYCYPFSRTNSADPKGTGQQYNQYFMDYAVQYQGADIINANTPVQIPYVIGYKAGGSNTPNKYNDDMATQQKTALAYYRYMYCLNNLLGSLLAGQGGPFSFIGNSKADNLEFQKNVVQQINNKTPPEGTGCQTVNTFVPDTQYCLDPAWYNPPPQGQRRGACSKPNPCFQALVESINAQCILYDDTVSGKILAGQKPMGVLEAFQLGIGVNLT